MPMPKLDDVFPHLDPKKADHELMAYAEACYAAGRVDERASLQLPEEGRIFYWRDERMRLSYLIEVKKGRWWATCTWDDSPGQIDGPDSGWASEFDLPIEKITIMYCMGELEEVK